MKYVEGVMVKETILQSVSEVNYLRAENVERYRMIIRYFYEEYQNIRYHLYKEDVLQKMLSYEYFEEYTMEKCQSDLASLVDWGNLVALQDSSKARTIEDFKNSRFRYLLSEKTVAIERMMIDLESLDTRSATLSPTLLERIRNQILEIDTIDTMKDATLDGWWTSLNEDFKRLNQNYQDYIRTFNNAKAEEMMKSTQFLLFKDKIITYLRTFIKELQIHGLVIEEYLTLLDELKMQQVFERITRYTLSVPVLGKQLQYDAVYQSVVGRWRSITNFFVGTDGFNEQDRLNDITDEIIRKITRFAQQIGELHNQGANKKEEYRKIKDMFATCDSLDEAHRFSAYVFGVDTTIHLKDTKVRETDSIDVGVYDEASTFVSLEPRNRMKKNRKPRVPAIDREMEKLAHKANVEAKRKAEMKRMEALIHNNCIAFDTLGKIDTEARKTLLKWLSKGLANQDLSAKTDDGKHYRIDTTRTHETCLLTSEDGILKMPVYRIVFEVE